jgi:translation elongation factor EF-G
VRSLRGSRWQIFVKIQLPGALPYVFSGMKVASVLAVAGAIVGEFIASDRGLGYLMLQVQVTLDTPASYWMANVYSQKGDNIYSLNDRQVSEVPFSIVVEPVNDAPSFTKGADQIVLNVSETEFVWEEHLPGEGPPAVEEGAREALEKGPLGFPVVDVGVVLTDGRFHSVDSSEFAFRTAGRMGVRQALSEASPVLMQPIFRVDIHVPSQFSGGLVPIVSALKGQVLGFDRDEAVRGWDTFRALIPANALEDLAHSIRSATQGVGYFASNFDRYEELYGREAEAVVTAHAKAG